MRVIRLGFVLLALLTALVVVSTAPAAPDGKEKGKAAKIAKAKKAKAKAAKVRVVTTEDQNIKVKVTGVKYDDLNGNGTQDSGEPGLAGWTINAFGGASTVAATTGSDGSYALELDEGHRYTICEELQSGWKQTAPGNDKCSGSSAATGGYRVDLGCDELARSLQTGDGCFFGNDPTCDAGSQPTRALATFEQKTVSGCDFGNARETGRIIVVKDLDPDTDTGRFDLLVNGNVEKDDAADGESTPAVTVPAGENSVAEAAGTGTSLDNYNTTLDCVVQVAQERTLQGVSPGSGPGAGPHTVNVGAGQTVVCTFTNERKSSGVTPPPPPPPGGGGGGGSSAPPVPNVSITKQVSAPSVVLGQDITWTLNVSNSNAGPTAENVVVSDTIPAGVTYKSATPSQGGGCSFDSGTSKVTCSLGSLASNASATIAIVTTATTAGTYENVAVVTTTTPETTTSDNTATATSAGAPLAPPTVAPPAVSPAARVCGSLAINVKRLTIGTRTVIRATVRDKSGKALGGVRVVVRGAGINAAAKAGKQGVARIAVIARSPGVVTVRVVGASVCSKRLGSLGEFQPPVTG